MLVHCFQFYNYEEKSSLRIAVFNQVKCLNELIDILLLQIHYESKTLHEENVSPRIANEQVMQQSRKGGTKKASLFAWMTLQSIPEETIISPHILEFLEQTLEPIPSSLQQAKTSG